MGRVLEPEVMDAAEEAIAYDELERLFGQVLFQGFAESAVRMGVATGRVLDVGTGPGRIAIRVAKLNPGYSIDGIDLSKSMLALAERNARDQGVGHIAKCAEGNLFVSKQSFIPGRLCLAVLSHQPASFQQRSARVGSDAPRIRAAKGEG